MPDDYDYQERAAILEYCAGLARPDAEAAARCYCARQNHLCPSRQAVGYLAAPHPPDSAGAPGGAAAPAPQPPVDPAADRRAPADTAERDDPGAGYSRRQPAPQPDPGSVPYAVAAARASPVYLESRRQLAEILNNNRPKGATP